MTTSELEKLLQEFRIPAENIPTTAFQLQKRAHQLAEKKGMTEEEALNYLIRLLKQGWIAKQNP